MTKQLIRVVKLLVKVCIVLLHFYSFLEPACGNFQFPEWGIGATTNYTTNFLITENGQRCRSS